MQILLQIWTNPASLTNNLSLGLIVSINLASLTNPPSIVFQIGSTRHDPKKYGPSPARDTINSA
jgi:hypothetical protein